MPLWRSSDGLSSVETQKSNHSVQSLWRYIIIVSHISIFGENRAKTGRDRRLLAKKKRLRLLTTITDQEILFSGDLMPTIRRHAILIPPSHLFGISRNQAEPAGMKNFQNSRHIREGISNPSHTEGGMSRNDVGMEILYTFIGGVLNYVRTHSRANRDVPTAFEPHSSGNREIPTTFELHSSWTLLISK